MGMIQIDMPMPDSCLECRFNTSEFGYCNAMPVEFVGQVSDCEEDGKPEWCPLKEQEPRNALNIVKVHEGTLGNCPTCGAELMDYYNETLCGRCGQAVKWE